MTDYAYPQPGSITFGARDALAPGNAEKVIKGSQMDEQFNALVLAVNSKLNTLDPVIDGDLTGTTGSRIIGGTY
jgi:hypothetical protein